ncbi:hypothetical protein [Luteirhabdus pelagi]|jgi:hypothetical protein|nr:hypothetical protein [Luteirhabdus pelagi]MCT8341192.1 hypothetical protein [Thermobacterium salinum]
MSTDKTPEPKDKKSRKESAINIKQKESDGREINHQVEQRKEQHQPRDTA